MSGNSMYIKNKNGKGLFRQRHKRMQKQWMRLNDYDLKPYAMNLQSIKRPSIFSRAKLRLSSMVNWHRLSFLGFVFNLIFFSVWIFDDGIMTANKELMPPIAIVDYVELLDHFYETLPAKEIEFSLLNAKARIDNLSEQGVIIFDASLIQGAPREYYLPIHWLVQTDSY